MNILIYIFAGLAGLLVLLLIVAAVAPKSYRLSRSIHINKSPAEVYDYIRLVRNSEHYSKWVMLDPKSRREYRGEDGTVGFVYAWESNMKNVGKGEQEITGMKNDERVDYEIRFAKPFEGKADSSMTVAPDNSGSTVSWSFATKMKYPMNIMILMNMDKMIGKDIQESLANLKNILER